MKQSFSVKSQQGSGMFGMALLVIAIGLLGKFALAVVPDYISYYQLTKLVEKELKNANASQLTDSQFLENFNRQLAIDSVGFPQSDKNIVTVTKRTPGALAAKIKYETENLYYGDTYVVNRFEKEINPTP